ncbi:MAG: thioredoxin family protein [Saprospiraceae bacterium]|nr:thioredoxin family protein [Saprospiraceae bacterium]
MKKLVFVALAFVSINSMQAQGIGFIEDQSWESILENARETNRIIFVDAYASWCGPCKAMSKEVFILPTVGAFFNEHFINVKLNVEKGDGPNVASHYGVQVIPTYLFVNGDGDLIHSGLGYLYEEDLLELGAVALDPSRNIGGLRTRYQAGEDDPDFLRTFATMLADASDPQADEVVQAYLRTQEDLSTETNMEFILLSLASSSSPYYDYVLQNLGVFAEVYGEETVVDVLQSAIYNDLYGGDPQPEMLQKADALFRRTMPEDAAVMANVVRIIYYQNTENWNAYSDQAIKYFTDNADEIGWGEYNEHAWYFYEHVSDPAKMNIALEWARKSVEMNENYYNLDTLAHLYAKLGKKKEAKTAAKGAIEIAKVTGDDYSSTQELLDSL